MYICINQVGGQYLEEYRPKVLAVNCHNLGLILSQYGPNQVWLLHP